MISCVIPAFNEEANIGQVVASIKATMADVKAVVDEVIVVDDGSSDRSGAVAERAGAIVLQHLLNRGQGAALRTGTAYALTRGAAIIVHFDADGQFRAADIPRLVAPLAAGKAEIVFGSRFLGGTVNNLPPVKRYLLMPAARLVNRLFFGIKLTDPQSGLRALSAGAAQRLEWQEDRMAHCSEILWQAHRLNLKITEVPMTVVYREFGQGLSGGWRIIKDLLINKLSR